LPSAQLTASQYGLAALSDRSFRHLFRGHIPVCTENLNPDMVMKFAQNQERFEGSGSLNRCFAN
jgi:hypothetical protein